MRPPRGRPRCPSLRSRHCCRARRCDHKPRDRLPPSPRPRRPAASAVNALARPPSASMRPTVSAAAAVLRWTQNTVAPSRANVTAAALPLPQPGPDRTGADHHRHLALETIHRFLPFVFFGGRCLSHGPAMAISAPISRPRMSGACAPPGRSELDRSTACCSARSIRKTTAPYASLWQQRHRPHTLGPLKTGPSEAPSGDHAHA